MKISFHGAARTVTGSKHIVHLDSGKKILLDCGMFQGLGKDTVRLNSEFGFDPNELSHVILSHGHIDHIGLLPKLVKDGYGGKIYCTPATADIVKLLLMDSARIQEADVKYVNKQRDKERREKIEPLYTVEDANNVFPLLETIPYNEKVKLDDEVELLYTDCGHILGSAAVNLILSDRGKKVTLTFSGDVGRYRDTILRSPQPFPQADYIIIESTYGDSLHDMMITAIDELLRHIQHTCIEKKGKLIVAAFSLGRTQELLFLLNRLDLENRLPKLNYYVDSPLSVKTTEIVKNHPECFNKQVQKLLKRDDDVFGFEGLTPIVDVEDSIALNESKEPCVIISASGMAEAGRVKHHIAHNVGDAKNTILITGYCEPQSLGARLQHHDGEVGIFGKQYRVNAEVEAITSLSAHGDYDDLCQWLACQDKKLVQKVFLVHGEYDVQLNFKERLSKKGFDDVIIPDLHEEIGLG
jgi:metallo-beta-lactamase family protein